MKSEMKTKEVELEGGVVKWFRHREGGACNPRGWLVGRARNPDFFQHNNVKPKGGGDVGDDDKLCLRHWRRRRQSNI